ncbi:hypothetical protein IMZ48_48920 [Candidatus Bathyarchaeota archaeon]|nr:hypothetical protein [Candidatus Bathyarchaeota archaeon]
MLESQQGRDALTDLTIQLDSRRPATLGGPMCHGNHTEARAQVDIFLRKVRAQFPPVVINYTMTNIDNLGVTMRPPWDGHLEDFNPKTSLMYLNGSVRLSCLSSLLLGC